MIEEHARDWFKARFPDAVPMLEVFATELLAEAARQNLVSASSLPTLWSRHLVDSAQLIDLAPMNAESWLDVGSGAGFPGLVIAILLKHEVELVEPRRRRADFLKHVVNRLGLSNVVVQACAIERTKGVVDVISARAVASLHKLLTLTAARRSASTTYLLPKGASALQEVDRARSEWHGMFHVKQSITNAQSFIVTATGVSACTE